MSRSRPITFLAGAALVALAALAVAACGGGSAATAAASKPSSGASPTVHVANSSLGSILVDSQGRTLYLFKADTGTKSSCTGACAVAWPPLSATGHLTAGSGASSAKLGTTTGSGGGGQVTYNEHPLYLYSGDTKPGEVTGQGSTAFGAAWYVVSAAGDQITSRPSSSNSASSSGGSSGAGY